MIQIDVDVSQLTEIADKRLAEAERAARLTESPRPNQRRRGNLCQARPAGIARRHDGRNGDERGPRHRACDRTFP
jgi:hypothetical protein